MELNIGAYSLEKMIGCIANINRVSTLQFSIYQIYQEQYPQKEAEKTKLLTEFDLIEDLFQEKIKLDSFFKKDSAEHLGFTSFIKKQNGFMGHIPMIDFNCPYSIENLLKIEKTLYMLAQGKGFLLESGKSYHFYGIKLLSVEEWVNFTKLCAEQDIIGKHWPYFQLQRQRGYSTLRISTSTQKPHLPKVIAKIGSFEI